MIAFEEKLISEQAKNLNLAIFYVGEEIIKGLQNEIEPIKNAEPQLQDQIRLIVAVLSLFETEIFLSKTIKDQKLVEVYKKYCEFFFEEIAEVNPTKLLLEIKQADNPIEWFGFRILKILGIEDASLKMEISLIYFSYLKYGFYESLRKALSIVS